MTENTPSLVEVIREAREMWHMMSPRFKREVSMDEAIAKSLLAAGLVGEGWQTMDTAPRDGTTIFGQHAKRGQRGMVSFQNGEWEMVDGLTNMPMGIGFYPTHWRLLPAPPRPAP